MVNLRAVTKDNYRECIKLKLKPGQDMFVASNVYSIAQSKFETTWQPRAIYSSEELVGFLMYGDDIETGEVWIIRLMIDQAYQGNGYGKQAMEALLQEIKDNYTVDKVLISFVPTNEVAKNLYMSLGFKDTGRVEDGEVVYCLTYN